MAAVTDWRGRGVGNGTSVGVGRVVGIGVAVAADRGTCVGDGSNAGAVAVPWGTLVEGAAEQAVATTTSSESTLRATRRSVLRLMLGGSALFLSCSPPEPRTERSTPV